MVTLIQPASDKRCGKKDMRKPWSKIKIFKIFHFCIATVKLDRHIITEFDKMKIDIYAIRIFTFYLPKLSFLFHHKQFFLISGRISHSKKKYLPSQVKSGQSKIITIINETPKSKIALKSLCVSKTWYRPLLDFRAVHFGRIDLGTLSDICIFWNS